MILGTSQVFAEGSIYTTIASNDSGNICTKINLAFDYLVSLWTVSHAVWTQAYEIKKQNFEKNAIEKKTRAESAIAAFEQVKDEAIPNHCHCIEANIFYASLNHLINPHETVSIGAKSATGCQGKCQADTQCKAWTFYKTNLTCFKHTDDLRPLSVGESGQGLVFSGPPECPTYYSFCCEMGFELSVFVTLLIVLVALAFLCCCCVVVWKYKKCQKPWSGPHYFYFDKVQQKKQQEVRTQEYDQEDVDAEEEHNRPLNALYVSKFDIIKI